MPGGAVILLALAQFALGEGCETVGSEVFCPPREALEDGPFRTSHMLGFLGRVDNARKRLRAKEQEVIKDEQSNSTLRQRIGHLMASGECDAAYSEALRAGDFQLARDVKSLCPSVPNGSNEPK